jgi:hypothetical protein
MPRVFPSQIRGLINTVLSSRQGRGLEAASTPQILAILDLIQELPEELLTLSGNDYSAYRVSIRQIKNQLKIWQKNPVGMYLEPVENLETIEKLLTKCPDEAPSPAAEELTFIADPDLRNDMRVDISAAYRALHDGIWKGATVLAGSAAEALLRWAISDRRSSEQIEDARQAEVPAAKRDPDRWDLDEYAKVAERLGLIDPETRRSVDLARGFRNLIHPGRAKRLTKVCDRGTALTALAAVELIVRDLKPADG